MGGARRRARCEVGSKQEPSTNLYTDSASTRSGRQHNYTQPGSDGAVWETMGGCRTGVALVPTLTNAKGLPCDHTQPTR